MDLQKSLKQAWEILTLKEPTMQAVAKDPEALSPALVILGLASIASALGTFLFPSVMGMVVYRSGLNDVLAQAGLSIFLGIAMLYITGYFAEQIFHSKLDMNGYVRVMGHATLANVLGISPALSVIGGIWGLVVMCVALNKIGKLEAGSIILLLLMEALLFIGIWMILVFFSVDMGLGGIELF